MKLSNIKQLFLTCMIMLGFAIMNQSHAQCNIDDWEGLQAVYLTTIGANWDVNTGWDLVDPNVNIVPPPGCDLSTMHGVTLDPTGRVQGLFLSNNSLTGAIPANIEYLTNLNYLYLDNNQLTGSITNTIGKLTNLIQLRLHDNQLSGTIPTEIGDLSNLNYLYLNNNQLASTIPASFSNLTNIILIRLHDNLLSGCYDPSLTNLCNLTNANISDGNNFDAPWEDFCLSGSGACTICATYPHVEVQSADIYLDDACYGVILTSPNGSCYRLKVQDDGSFISELVTCP